MLPGTKRLRIGLWGYGQHGKRSILPAIISSQDCQLIGICTTSADKALELKSKYDVKVWRNPEAMLANPCVNVVYLATPIGLHYIQAKQVLAAGKHLLCEKSLTHDGSQSLDLIDDAKKRGLLLFETFMYLYHPQFQLLRDIVYDNSFGEIMSVTCNFCIPDLDVPGFRDSKVLGGGAFLDVGCYPVSLILSLVKEFPKIIFCEISSQKEGAVDVSGKALIRYSSAATAYLNWGYHRAYKNDLSVLGKYKSVYVDKVFSKSRDTASTVTVMDECGVKTDLTVPPVDSFMKMFEVFAQAMDDPHLKEQFSEQGKKQAQMMSHLFQSALHTDSAVSL